MRLGGTGLVAAQPQALAQLALDPVEELVHAGDQPFMLEHQRVASTP